MSYLKNQFQIITPALYFDAIIFKKKAEGIMSSGANTFGAFGDIDRYRGARIYQKLFNNKNFEDYSIYVPDRSKPVGPDNKVYER